jgi:hypothetical protein
MALMQDTEGYQIPLDSKDGIELFDLQLYAENGTEPKLTLNAPSYFETEAGVYDSLGILRVSLYAVLNEYIEYPDGTDNLLKMAEWFRSYADRLESAHELVNRF